MNRPAKDISGQSLAPGDRVATMPKDYRYTLAVGTVDAILPKKLRIRLNGELVIRADCQVAKVPA